MLCAITALCAVASVALDQEWVAYVGITAVVMSLIGTRFYGHHESKLLGQQVKNFAVSLVPLGTSREVRLRELRARLEGNRQWDELWETLLQFADQFDLSKVQLNIMLPAHGEEYHASWERKGPPDENEVWHSDIPLITQHVSIGRLKITGVCNGDNVCTWMSDLIAGLKPFESQLLELLSECIQTPEAKVAAKTPPMPHPLDAPRVYETRELTGGVTGQ
jgi:UDP-GlcNAc:undecaprenyl-phosphate GlcNAc-1-phosphate transferase